MKINNALPSVGSAPDGARTRTAGTASPRSESGAETHVEFSAMSARLQALGAAGGAGAVVDAKRVAEIKAAIAEGRFKVDPERIADGLLNSVRQLLGKHNPTD